MSDEIPMNADVSVTLPEDVPVRYEVEVPDGMTQAADNLYQAALKYDDPDPMDVALVAAVEWLDTPEARQWMCERYGLVERSRVAVMIPTSEDISPELVDDDATEEDVALAPPEPRVKLSGTVRPVTGWIPFDPQNPEANPLPKDGGLVFLVGRSEIPFIGWWSTAYRLWQTWVNEAAAVTHWRPIEWPEPPS